MESQEWSVVDLSSRQLTEISDDVIENAHKVLHLDLSESPKLQLSDFLCKFQNVISLKLERCKIIQVPEEVFHLIQLQMLSLSGNRKIKFLNPSIGNLHGLKELILKDCRLECLPDALWGLQNLKKLDLQGNHVLRAISPSIKNLQFLEELNLGSCGLSKLPEELWDLKNLEQLNLSGNHELSDLSPSIRKLTSLKDLNIGYCLLLDLPEGLWEISSLEKLDLSLNILHNGLNSSIQKLQSLKEFTCGYFGKKSELQFSKEHALEKLYLTGNKRLALDSFSFGKLRYLKQLAIKGFQAQCLPEDLSNLFYLEVLKLENIEQLESLCLPFGELKSLKSLHISRSQMKSLPESFGHLQKLEVLELVNNKQLESLRSSFGQLSSLKVLHISGCGIKCLPESFGQLQKLEVLKLEANEQLETLCPSFGELKLLKELHISHSRMKSLPESFGKLQNLKALHLHVNKELEDIGLSFGKLRELKTLCIQKCGLRNLPETFKDLKKLEVLHLNSNKQLKNFASSIGVLTSLRELFISNCQIKSLPESFGQLHNLQCLIISGISISCSADLYSSTAVSEMYKYAGSFIEDRHMEDIELLESLCVSFGQLRALEVLHISYCRIKSLPDSFCQLHKLKSLDLRSNRLEEYPKCTLGLENLRVLDLSNDRWISDGNAIQSLPNDLVKSNLEELILDGNPITLPPKSVWKQGLSAIKLFMQEQQFSGTDQLIADSINMLGESGAGKTSIASFLEKGYQLPAAKDDRTRVVSRRSMNFKDVSVCINDFGGHSIYQTVIPVIMPSTGLAIVAFDLTKAKSDQEREVAKWVLTAIAKSSDIRILVAGTRSDKVSLEECPSLIKNIEKVVQKEILAELKGVVETALWDAPNDQRWKALQAMKLKLQKPNVKFATVCCIVHIGNNDFEEFRTLVEDSVQKPQPLPSRWCKLMMDVVTHESKVPFISMEFVREKYKSVGFKDDNYEHLEVILNCLVDMSQIIWLKNHESLKEVVFHSPQQIVDICKKVFHHNIENVLHDRYKTDKEQYSNGFLTEKYLKYLLDETDLHVVNTIVEFLQNFNLLSTFQPRGGITTRKFAIASNLPKEEPCRVPEVEKRLCANSCVRVDLSFEGSIIPLSFFETSLLMISTRVSKQFRNEPIITMWYNGLMIEHDRMGLVMRRPNEQPKIALTAASLEDDRNPWTILFYVMKFLAENMSISWPGVMAKWMIWCPGCIFLKEQHSGSRELDYATHNFVDYTSTLRRQNSGKNVCLHFNNCPHSHSVPRVLCDPIPEDFTTEEDTYVKVFYKDLQLQNESVATRTVEVDESTLSRKWHDMDDKQLQEIFRTLSYDLINTMTPEQILDTTWRLWSLKLIISTEKDAVLLPGKTPFEAASKLIDIITTKNKKELYCEFLNHQAKLKRTDIIEAFTKLMPKIS